MNDLEAVMQDRCSACGYNGLRAWRGLGYSTMFCPACGTRWLVGSFYATRIEPQICDVTRLSKGRGKSRKQRDRGRGGKPAAALLVPDLARGRGADVLYLQPDVRDGLSREVPRDEAGGD